MNHVNSTCKIRNVQIRPRLAPYFGNQGPARWALAVDLLWVGWLSHGKPFDLTWPGLAIDMRESSKGRYLVQFHGVLWTYQMEFVRFNWG